MHTSWRCKGARGRWWGGTCSMPFGCFSRGANTLRFHHKAERSSGKKRRGSVTDPAANANNLPQFLPLPPSLVPCSTVARLRVINKRLWMPQLVLLPLLLRLMNFLMIISASSGGDGDGDGAAAVGHLSLRSALRFEGFLMDSSVESKAEEKNSENCVGEKVERGQRKWSSSFLFFRFFRGSNSNQLATCSARGRIICPFAWISINIPLYLTLFAAPLSDMLKYVNNSALASPLSHSTSAGTPPSAASGKRKVKIQFAKARNKQIIF